MKINEYPFYKVGTRVRVKSHLSYGTYSGIVSEHSYAYRASRNYRELFYKVEFDHYGFEYFCQDELNVISNED